MSEATLQASPERQVSGCRPRTPLFVGFTRNEPLLAQAVLSYIVGGRPGSDIIVVDNTIEFNKNASSLDHDKYRRQYGVNILQTPTQLSFSQLQNFFIFTARQQDWQYFFWTHMDIVVLSYQYPLPSLYQRVISSLENITSTGTTKWAFGWYRYDPLSLVNVAAAEAIGPWDVNIPYYTSDCDYYRRARLHGFQITDFEVGHIIDVDSRLLDADQQLLHGSYHDVCKELLELGKQKKRQRQSSSFFLDRFEPGREVISQAGRKWYKQKWNSAKCT